ncbi:MAG: ferritin family protein [Candidatus Dojkabacteria bacterium]|nr:ferritin family protein [Candidatus Dojkabacteria bacterium]
MTCVNLTKEKSDKLNQKFTNQELLRSGIIAELDAINLYQSQIENIDNEESKKIITHVMNEEKEHVAELTCALIKQDPSQGKYLKKFLKTVDIDKLDCIGKNND